MSRPSVLPYYTPPMVWILTRRAGHDIPQTMEQLCPQWPYIKEVRQKDEEFKRKQKENFDRRHRVRPLAELPDDTDVWITTGGHPTPGRMISHCPQILHRRHTYWACSSKLQST